MFELKFICVDSFFKFASVVLLSTQLDFFCYVMISFHDLELEHGLNRANATQRRRDATFQRNLCFVDIIIISIIIGSLLFALRLKNNKTTNLILGGPGMVYATTLMITVYILSMNINCM